MMANIANSLLVVNPLISNSFREYFIESLFVPYFDEYYKYYLFFNLIMPSL